MKFNVIDMESLYRRLLADPNADARLAMYQAELVAPYAGMFQMFGGGDPLQMFAMWGILTPDDFANGNRESIAQMVDVLTQYGAWARSAKALEFGREQFAAYEDQIGIDTIHHSIVLCRNLMVPDGVDRGFAGFGAMPGYIMVSFTKPTAENMRFLEGATVHELHHNIRFKVVPFNPMVDTLADYMVAEGLAESFAVACYGEENLSPYIADVQGENLDKARSLAADALEARGFDTLRSYIFGDRISAVQNRDPIGMPDYGGYALGYHVVQAYLKRTGKTVPEATFVSGAEIVAASEYFG